MTTTAIGSYQLRTYRSTPLRLAYADPPYLGQGKLYAKHHPDAYDFDNPETHRQLIEQLENNYDGWALSASSPSMATLLPMLPPGTRTAVWVKPFAAYKRNVRIAYTWEPIFFKPGRDSSTDGAMVNHDHIQEPITLRKGLVGAKPERVCRWILDLLGWKPGDHIDDLFPGTGVFNRVRLAAEASPEILRERSGWIEERA